MTTKTVSPDRYLQQLRVLGAWWRLGSSALKPQLLIECEPLAEEERWIPSTQPS